MPEDAASLALIADPDANWQRGSRASGRCSWAHGRAELLEAKEGKVLAEGRRIGTCQRR